MGGSGWGIETGDPVAIEPSTRLEIVSVGEGALLLPLESEGTFVWAITGFLLVFGEDRCESDRRPSSFRRVCIDECVVVPGGELGLPDVNRRGLGTGTSTFCSGVGVGGRDEGFRAGTVGSVGDTAAKYQRNRKRSD